MLNQAESISFFKEIRRKSRGNRKKIPKIFMKYLKNEIVHFQNLREIIQI